MGNSQTRRVARWDSQAWRALGPDLDSYPYGLVRHHAETVVIEGSSYRMKDRDNPAS